MNRPLSLRLWLHRIGYVTTAIIAAELLLMAGFGAASAYEQAMSDRADRAARRTYERPLASPRIQGRFAALARENPAGPDSLKVYTSGPFCCFAIMILSAGQNGAPAHGVEADYADDGTPMHGVTHFEMPAAAYAAAMRRFDQLTDGRPGDTDIGADGAHVAFERVRGARVTSGEGSTASRTPHYSDIMKITSDIHRTYAKAGDDQADRGGR